MPDTPHITITSGDTNINIGLASPGGQTHVCPLLVSADLRTSAASRLRRPCCILVSVEKVWRFGFYLWLSTAQLLRGLRRRSPNTLSLDMSLIRKLLQCKRRLKKPRNLCLSRFTVSLVQIGFHNSDG